MPPEACSIHNCNNCVKGTKSFILTKDQQLIAPQSFILRHLESEVSNVSTSYACMTDDNVPCDCEKNLCTGSELYCSMRNCSDYSSCKCTLTHYKPQLVAITEDTTITDPDVITFEICLIDRQVTYKRHKGHRALLEGEAATFKDNNLTISFEDPILRLPDIGRVIIRSQEFEHVMNVPHDLLIKIPFELLAYKADIQIIYLHPSGKTASGEIHVSGKSVCQIRQCILCFELFYHFKCFPAFLQYFLYAIALICVLVSIICVKMLIKSILFILRLCIMCIYALYKIIKQVLRLSLLLGAFSGDTVSNIVRKAYEFLELQAAQRANMATLPLVILTLSLVISTGHSDCNSHSIIQSDLKTCEISNDGTRHCKLYTTAEITLNTIASQSCLWFADKHSNHLFSLKVKLDSVQCDFKTERQYFTFPVKPYHLSQVSCIFNKFCGQGVHCIKSHIGRGGLHFEAETAQSRDFPGISGCEAGQIGNGCFILTRAACNFYRTWYEPDLINSYEVSAIRGHTCKYHISVQHTENNTISRLVVTDSAYTDSGIKITILGAYDQPQLHIDDSLIQSVTSPNEAYLAPTSKRNNPKVGEIGVIQANTSFTKDFIFDPLLTSCDFFENVLRCNTADDALASLKSSNEYALPLQRDIHLFKMNNGKLQSQLLISSAVRLQLHFADYKLAVHTHTVCPNFGTQEIRATGCYNCQILARIVFTGHSTCQPGVVTVEFQELMIYTKAITLSTEPTELTIKFYAETRCYNEKLCLKSSTAIKCLTLNFCLQEPSIELKQLNINATNTVSSQTVSSWWEGIHFPNFNTSLLLLKILGSSLLIICLIITISSACLTCCCRSK